MGPSVMVSDTGVYPSDSIRIKSSANKASADVSEPVSESEPVSDDLPEHAKNSKGMNIMRSSQGSVVVGVGNINVFQD